MNDDGAQPEDEQDVEIVSGPFCRHWGTAGDCDERCARPGCGHSCNSHESGSPGECFNCDCQGWTEAE